MKSSFGVGADGDVGRGRAAERKANATRTTKPDCQGQEGRWLGVRVPTHTLTASRDLPFLLLSAQPQEDVPRSWRRRQLLYHSFSQFPWQL